MPIQRQISGMGASSSMIQNNISMMPGTMQESVNQMDQLMADIKKQIQQRRMTPFGNYTQQCQDTK
jgi:hypothetical protein